MQKTEQRSSSPFAPPVRTAHSSWDAFATECVDWMMARAHAGVLNRSTTAEGRLLAVFEVFASWLDGRDAEAASVVDSVLRLSDRHPVGRIVALQAPAVHAIVSDLGRQGGLVDVEEFADSWLILLRGTVLRAAEGDATAPVRAGDMAADLIARHRRRPFPESSAYDEESEFGWVDDARPPRSLTGVGGSTGVSNFDWLDGYDWDIDAAIGSRPAW